MKKIAIFSLLSISNFGEQFIADCVKYLVDRNDSCESEVYQLEGSINAFIFFIYSFLIELSKIFNGSVLGDKFKLLSLRIRNAKHYERCLENADAVIIGAGSYKYSTQKLWADYSILVETASKKGLPVMFNSMNIQKYNSKSWKCKYLAKHTNYPNVRMFTTRDMDEGIRKLREDYQIGDHVDCCIAADPAFWIPECYGVKRDRDNGIIGINVLNGKNFRSYGGSLSSDKVIDFYCELLHELDKRQLKWELFTNGMRKDYQCGEKILQKYGKPSIQIKVPKTAADAVKLVSSYKAVLGARLHVCICAYAMDVPFTGLSWDEKFVHFAEMAKIEDLFYSEKELDPKRIADKLSLIAEQGYSYDVENRNYWKQKTAFYLNQYIDS